MQAKLRKTFRPYRDPPIQTRAQVIEHDSSTEIRIPAMKYPLHAPEHLALCLGFVIFLLIGVGSLGSIIGSMLQKGLTGGGVALYNVVFSSLLIIFSIFQVARNAYLFLWRASGTERIVVSRQHLIIEYSTMLAKRSREYEMDSVRKVHATTRPFVSPSNERQMTVIRTTNIRNYTFLAFMYNHEMVYFGRELSSEDQEKIVAVIERYDA